MKSEKTWVIAAALALTIPVLVMFTPTAESATTTRVLLITNDSAKPQVAFRGFDGNPPKLFDFNGDGKLEIIAQNDNQWVYIFDSKTGAILAQMRTTLPAGWGARSFNGPEAAILTDGGSPRLIVMNSAATVTMFRFDQVGSSSTHFVFHKEWERRLTECYSNPGSDSKPTLADLDNDGDLEIILTTEERGIYVLRNDRSLMWHNCVGGGNAEATVGDLNRDGTLDVVHVGDGGVVSALNGRNGAYLWAFNVHSKFNLGSGSIPVGAAVGQLDGLTGPDVVFGARDSHDATNWANDHAVLVALSAGGTFMWGKQDPSAAPLTYTHPIITDAANDGSAEVYWADWNTIGHKPPMDESQSWKVQGPGHAFRYDKSGNLVWKAQLDSFWHNKDIALADVDADGVQEVLANGANFGRDGIWYIDSNTGAKERHIETYPYQVARGPVLGDLYKTGKMQFVVEVGGGAAGGGPGIMVFDTQAPWNSKWPHLPYVTRARGTEPTTSTTTPTTTSAGGTFGATFTIKNPNEWWQQLAVAPDTQRTLSSAKVRINGGAWQPMTFRADWGPSGEWTSSYNAKAGSRVEFLATDLGGATSQSQPFTWMDGVLTKRSVGSTTSPTPTTTTTTTTTPGGTFAATFTIKSPNEWWQQLAVAPDTQRTLSSAKVRINGGAWQSMTFRADWGPSGEWTSSYNTKAGSRVEFLATDMNGATSQSQPFTWMDGTLTKRSTGSTNPTPTTSTSGSTFTATFSPKAVGNDWWVETDVSSSQMIVRVEVSINGGAWTELVRQSWGSWAKSMHVPNGSSVQFRAMSDSGAMATSGTYTWT